VLETFHRAPLDPDEEWLDFLQTLAGQAAIAIEDAQLFQNLQKSNIELLQAYDATIEGWSRALDLRDKETEGHTRRVTEMAIMLGGKFGMSDKELQYVRWGGLLHDIGKMAVPDRILLKPDTLTSEETEIMKQHPLFALQMLSAIHYLKPALDIPYCHHERWDGTGYPRGLKGEEIPLAARIFAIADVYDALSSDRPYRSRWAEADVIEYIRQHAASIFDPQIVNVFLQMTEEKTSF
jgi:putative nucleotidyltransferase with HDIG domain